MDEAAQQAFRAAIENALETQIKRLGDSKDSGAYTEKPLQAIWPKDKRALGVLAKKGITTVGQAESLSDQKLMAIPDFGRGSLHTLRFLILRLKIAALLSEYERQYTT